MESLEAWRGGNMCVGFASHPICLFMQQIQPRREGFGGGHGPWGVYAFDLYTYSIFLLKKLVNHSDCLVMKI